MRTVHYKNAVQDYNFCMDTMLSLLAHTKEDFFMLYNVVVNDWGETTYVPTALGNILLVVVLIALHRPPARRSASGAARRTGAFHQAGAPEIPPWSWAREGGQKYS